MRGYDRYRRSQVSSANKSELVLYLFQEAVKRIHLAQGFPLGDAARIRHLHHVREIYMELDLALDYEAAPELASRMHRLYEWCLGALIHSANGPEAEKNLADALRVTENLRDGWFGVVRQPTARSA